MEFRFGIRILRRHPLNFWRSPLSQTKSSIVNLLGSHQPSRQDQIDGIQNSDLRQQTPKNKRLWGLDVSLGGRGEQHDQADRPSTLTSPMWLGGKVNLQRESQPAVPGGLWQVVQKHFASFSREDGDVLKTIDLVLT